MEASPAPEEVREADSKKISFRFCRECSNMLYPREDRENSTLMFACRTCQFSEPAGASCIYRNSLKETIAETPGNVQDVAQDPTVGKSSVAAQKGSRGGMRLVDEEGNTEIGSDFDDELDDIIDPESPDYAYSDDNNYEYDAMDLVDSVNLEVLPSFCTLCGEEILCPLCERPTDRGVMLEAEDPETAVQRGGEDAVQLEQRERALSGAGTVS